MYMYVHFSLTAVQSITDVYTICQMKQLKWSSGDISTNKTSGSCCMGITYAYLTTIDIDQTSSSCVSYRWLVFTFRNLITLYERLLHDIHYFDYYKNNKNIFNKNEERCRNVKTQKACEQGWEVNVGPKIKQTTSI